MLWQMKCISLTHACSSICGWSPISNGQPREGCRGHGWLGYSVGATSARHNKAKINQRPVSWLQRMQVQVRKSQFFGRSSNHRSMCVVGGLRGFNTIVTGCSHQDLELGCQFILPGATMELFQSHCFKEAKSARYWKNQWFGFCQC